MFVQLAETDALEITAGVAPARSIAAPKRSRLLDDIPPSLGKGIVVAIALSAPFWALVAYTIYLLS